MSSSLDPDAVDVVPERRPGEFGPSDSSDSASDVIGTQSADTDSDSAGTGERSSVESIQPTRIERDIAPDKVILPLEPDDDASVEK
ncbi:MAG: hypothetical protein JWM03_1504 [Rhodocyclales bacterium]|nr:hypothetical protein [Rhodocyclales bacterium]MDB5888632.1 hypothetical protein [Rhodocyclales bacterium]